jgi:thiamine transport system permease protein
MALLIAPPLLSVLASLPALPRLGTAQVARAAMTSLTLALAASALAVGLALMLAFAARQPDTPGAGRWIDLAVLALIGLPPFAFVTGLFVLLRGFGGLDTVGLVLVPLVNALMALPFVYRLVAPPLKVAEARHGRLARSLRIAGLNRLKLIDGPLVRGPALAAGALAMSLSLGDFGVIALFGGGDLVTLPYLMAERMGAYRMEEAGAVALLLVTWAALLAFLAQRAAKAGGPE